MLAQKRGTKLIPNQWAAVQSMAQPAGNVMITIPTSMPIPHRDLFPIGQFTTGRLFLCLLGLRGFSLSETGFFVFDLRLFWSLFCPLFVDSIESIIRWLLFDIFGYISFGIER